MLSFSYETEVRSVPVIGLVVLQADQTIERDMRRLLPDGVELLVSRVASGTHVTSESLAKMEAELAVAVALFPTGAKFAAIGYGCTSGTAEIGVDRIAELVTGAAETSAVTEPVSALSAACHHLGARRIGLLSPYVESVSDQLRHVLAADQIDVSAFASFNETEEDAVAHISPRSIYKSAVALAENARFDALFISCTNLRTLGVLDEIEAAIGQPVLSSNQVLAWHLLRLAGVSQSGEKAGQLWS
ncbi:MAG: Asp/Glu racemase [Pseudomonadota bacterium]